MTAGPVLFGTDLFGKPITHMSRLRQKYVVPPFSVLMAQSGEWQARKKAWLNLGLKSEVGRPDVQSRMKGLAKYMGTGAIKDGQAAKWIVTSIFDPVLCECAYRWWCPVGGQIIDPFAGGSVRGIVAGALGFKYWGCDLSQIQIDANLAQGRDLRPPVMPDWVCGDSLEAQPPMADFLFSCPPYGDLEVYSKDPKDISSMSFSDFAATYRKIIERWCGRLKDNRFACFVVGDYRDSDGILRNFPGGTIQAFKSAGLKLYNELILATVPGTAMVRASRQFNAGRKNVKTHQNILVFVKGDWHEAVKYMKSADPELASETEEVEEIEEEETEVDMFGDE